MFLGLVVYLIGNSKLKIRYYLDSFAEYYADKHGIPVEYIMG